MPRIVGVTSGTVHCALWVEAGPPTYFDTFKQLMSQIAPVAAAVSRKSPPKSGD